MILFVSNSSEGKTKIKETILVVTWDQRSGGAITAKGVKNI